MTTKSRPVPSLPGKRSNTSDPNNRVSTCSRCRLGIFRDQPRTWGRGEFIGLVHDFEGDDPCGM